MLLSVDTSVDTSVQQLAVRHTLVIYCCYLGNTVVCYLGNTRGCYLGNQL